MLVRYQFHHQIRYTLISRYLYVFDIFHGEEFIFDLIVLFDRNLKFDDTFDRHTEILQEREQIFYVCPLKTILNDLRINRTHSSDPDNIVKQIVKHSIKLRKNRKNAHKLILRLSLSSF